MFKSEYTTDRDDMDVYAPRLVDGGEGIGLMFEDSIEISLDEYTKLSRAHYILSALQATKIIRDWQIDIALEYIKGTDDA